MKQKTQQTSDMLCLYVLRSEYRMLICEMCRKEISFNQNEQVITRKDRATGDELHICQECFKKDMSVDYNTYTGSIEKRSKKAYTLIIDHGIDLITKKKKKLAQ